MPCSIFVHVPFFDLLGMHYIYICSICILLYYIITCNEFFISFLISLRNGGRVVNLLLILTSTSTYTNY